MAKKIPVVLFILCALLISAASQFTEGSPSGKGKVASSSQPTLDSKTIDRLAGLCRLWGAVKFCHPYLGYKDIDWDKALIEVLPAVRSAAGPAEYRAALERLLSSLGDKATYIIEKEAKEAGPRPSSAAPSPAGDKPKDHPYSETTEDGIAVVTATDYNQFSGETKPWNEMFMGFQRAFSQASKAEKVLLDFRNLGGPPSWLFNLTISRTFGVLLNRDLVLPPSRFIRHRGYASQKETSLYSSELAVRSGGLMPATGSVDTKASQFVVLVNAESADLSSVWTSMQESGLAVIIHEGPPSRETGSVSRFVDLTEGLQASVRTSEILRRDGGADFRPDLSVKDSARQAGLDILRGKRILQPSPVESAGPASSVLFSMAEKSYREMKAPDWNYRMLSLFRFWNVVNDFFPYKDLMDKPWAGVLGEFIPRFAAAEDETAYVLAVAELSTRLQDSHVTVGHPLLSRLWGTHSPQVRVAFIEGKTVITMVADPEAKKGGLEEGDIVLDVDGVATEAKRGSLARYIAASTPGRLNNLVDLYFLMGEADSNCELTVLKKSGETVKAAARRSQPGLPPRAKPTSLPVYTVLPEGYGYIDLGRIMTPDVDKALETIKATPGLILDMRGYPVGGANYVGQKLCRKKAVRAEFEFIEFDGASGWFSAKEERQYIEPLPDGPFPYDGKIVVLIGNSSQSAAEHTCLMLEMIADVTFIGSPTSGANGNITHTVLPGGIVISFTGMSVRHADGRQLQRMGVQPHIRVEPTVAGVLAGRDEVLERAVTFLKEKTR